MKKETKKAPTIRFRGFTDDWEQRKVGVLTVELSEYLPLSSGYPLLTSSRNGLIYQNEYRDTKSTNNQSTLFSLVPVGSCTYRHMSDDDVFHLNINNLESGLVSREYPVFLASNNNDLNFLVQNINFNPNFRSFCSAQKKGGTRTRLYYKNLCKFRLMIPSASEQKRVSEFLATIDSLITLHQRKLDQLKTLKKYFLQNMFPAKGEKVPRIRFKGFTGDWEQRKVTELGYIYIGLVTTMTSHYSNHGTLLIRNSDIKDSCFEFDKKPIFLDEEFAKQNASRRHQVGDVITVHTGDIGTSAVITEKEEGSIGFATIVTRPYKEKITSEYLCTYLNTDTHKNFALNISTGDGRNNYNLKDYYECVVPVPRIKEQMKIADFINALNNLITLHQRKLNQLQTMKKFMLQNMFI